MNHTRTRAILTAALLVALTVGRAIVGNSSSADAQVASPNDPNSYVTAMIKSLGLARIGLHRYDGLDLGTPEGIARGMTAGRLAAVDYARAATQVELFVHSSSEVISRSAKMAHSGYAELAEAEQSASSSLLDALKAYQSRGSVDHAGTATRISDVNVARERGWEKVLATSATSHYTLVRYPQDPKAAATHLNITAAQRLELLALLERMFGASVKQGLNETQDSAEAGAAQIYKSISTMPLKPADRK